MAEESHGGAGNGITVGELARMVGGRAEGDGSRRLTGIAGLEQAGPGDLSFVTDLKYARTVAQTKAGAVLVPDSLDGLNGCGAVLIRVADVSAALDRVSALLSAPPPPNVPGVHPTAVIGRGAVLGANVAIGPCAVVDEGATVGDGTVLGAHVFIGPRAVVGAGCDLRQGVSIGYRCEVGNNVVLHPGVVIGGDGFGYTFTGGVHRKIPQLGKVVIEDDVEIGSNTTVDRARFGATRVGCGTKIDNLVMIAHNVQIGRHCIITAQCGIAGSSTLGDYVVLGAQAGVVDHVHIGERAMVGAGSGVTKDIPAGGAYFGRPAEPRDRAARQIVALRKLPELLRTVKRLAMKVNELCEAVGLEKTPENH